MEFFRIACTSLSRSKVATLKLNLRHEQLRSRVDWYRRYATAQITPNDELSTIVEQFPPQIDFAFGYGSAVLHQQNSTPISSMIDIIMSVPDPHQWHSENMLRHPYYYSLISRLGGPTFVTWLQTNFGAKIYFHPYVDLDVRIPRKTMKRQIKYGVVATSDLIRDLRCWDYLYLAGRMHKPIVPIEFGQSEQNLLMSSDETRGSIYDAQRDNLLAAVSTSLLLVGGEASETTSSVTILPASKLYATIASLSYTGDFRMQTGAEDPNKITKLVDTPGMQALWETKYADTLTCLQNLGLLSWSNYSNNNENVIEFKHSDVGTRKLLVNNLPPRLQKHSDTIIGAENQSSIRLGSSVLRNELANIVAPAARSQGFKGIVTAGPSKSWKYAVAKFSKGLLRKSK